MTKKLSSYQKLKLEIKKLEKNKYELRRMIAKNDREEMRIVEICFVLEENLEKAWWFGNTSNKSTKHYSGILNQIKK